MRKMSVLIYMVLSLLMLCLVVGCSSHKSAKRLVPKPSPQTSATGDGVPKIDGTIYSAKASPDYTMIAVQWGTKDRYGLLILDPAKPAVICQAEEGFLCSAPWSPDSRWLAAGYTTEYMLLLGRDGEKRTVKTSHRVTSLVWSPNKTGRFYYSSDQDGSGIFEVDIDKGSERRIDFGHSIINLFVCRKIVCVAYFEKKGASAGYFNTDDHPVGSDDICVSELISRKRILQVSPDKENLWNSYYLEISPDGKYFFIHSSTASGGGVNAVARVQEADDLFTAPWKAVMFEDGDPNEDWYSVIWPGRETAQSSTMADQAIVYPPLYCERFLRSSPFLLELPTGCRNYPAIGCRLLDWWIPRPQADSNGCIAVTRDGLEISDQFGSDGELILRHKLNEK